MDMSRLTALKLLSKCLYDHDIKHSDDFKRRMSLPDLCSIKSSMCFNGCKKYKEKGNIEYFFLFMQLQPDRKKVSILELLIMFLLKLAELHSDTLNQLLSV